MSRPRVFIASSAEAADVVAGIQANLQRAAEVTPWTSAVFELSVTTLESLVASLASTDFGVFVLAKDDLLQIRGDSASATRDNVIFELGLFIGAIGKARCFMLIPDESDGLRIPTDLIGITPAKYESSRTDENWAAATSVACTQLSRAIGNMGRRAGRSDPLVSTQGSGHPEEDDRIDKPDQLPKEVVDEDPEQKDFSWINPYIEGRYADSITAIEASLAEVEDLERKYFLETVHAIAMSHLDPVRSEKEFRELIKASPERSDAYFYLGRQLIHIGNIDAANVVIDNGLGAATDVEALYALKVQCLDASGLEDQVAGLLKDAIERNQRLLKLYLQLARRHERDGNLLLRLAVIEAGLRVAPNSVELLTEYAEALAAGLRKEFAFVPYDDLIRIEPNNPVHIALRGNLFLELGFNDMAMRSYRRALELSPESQSWIRANIGNLLNNCSLFSDGIAELEHARSEEPESQYAVERLGSAMKQRDGEQSRAIALLGEARSELTRQRGLRVRMLGLDFGMNDREPAGTKSGDGERPAAGS